jgi:hypothetical protein
MNTVREAPVRVMLPDSQVAGLGVKLLADEVAA